MSDAEGKEKHKNRTQHSEATNDTNNTNDTNSQAEPDSDTVTGDHHSKRASFKAMMGYAKPHRWAFAGIFCCSCLAYRQICCSLIW